MKSFAMRHVSDLEAKISELQAMTRTLRHLASHCHGDARPDCPILDDLATPGAGETDEDAQVNRAKVRKPRDAGTQIRSFRRPATA